MITTKVKRNVHKAFHFNFCQCVYCFCYDGLYFTNALPCVIHTWLVNVNDCVHAIYGNHSGGAISVEVKT
jgi:hypothetical protein